MRLLYIHEDKISEIGELFELEQAIVWIFFKQ